MDKNDELKSTTTAVVSTETINDAGPDSNRQVTEDRTANNVPVDTPVCSTCGKVQMNEFKLKKCPCHTKFYCNRQCQKIDRKQHKKECLHLVKERNREMNKI